jgi:hypothetical protein
VIGAARAVARGTPRVLATSPPTIGVSRTALTIARTVCHGKRRDGAGRTTSSSATTMSAPSTPTTKRREHHDEDLA